MSVSFWHGHFVLWSTLVNVLERNKLRWLRDQCFILISQCYSFLFSDCFDKYDCTTWSGANDRNTEGVFIWEHSGSPAIFTNWERTNPNNYQDPLEAKDSVDIFYDGEWNDRPCDMLAAFVCEKWFYFKQRELRNHQILLYCFKRKYMLRYMIFSFLFSFYYSLELKRFW